MDTQLIASLVLVAAVNLWIAWRYAWQPIGPDEGIWLLWGFTGARYGRDFVDCKPPGIHLWMGFLAWITRRNLVATKFLHHGVMGAACVAAAWLSGSIGVGLLATAIVQSAWLKAYQSWMDAASGAMLLLAVLTPPWLSVLFIFLACLMNVKAFIPGALYLVIVGAWLPMLAAGVLGGAALWVWRWRWPVSLEETWWSTITVPARMHAWRKTHVLPDFTAWHEEWATSLRWMVVVLAVAFWGHLPLRLLVPATGYVLFNLYGGVWRPNHWLPLALVAAAGPPPWLAGLLLLAEFVSVRGYLGNIWAITYPGIALQLVQCQQVGERLKAEPGTLWVNSYHTQLYVYAGKKPEYQVKQLEIQDVTPERGKAFRSKLAQSPPDWIVVGPGFEDGQPRGYREAGRLGVFALLH